jgi:hypothetical protein
MGEMKGWEMNKNLQLVSYEAQQAGLPRSLASAADSALQAALFVAER